MLSIDECFLSQIKLVDFSQIRFFFQMYLLYFFRTVVCVCVDIYIFKNYILESDNPHVGKTPIRSKLVVIIYISILFRFNI